MKILNAYETNEIIIIESRLIQIDLNVSYLIINTNKFYFKFIKCKCEYMYDFM